MLGSPVILGGLAAHEQQPLCVTRVEAPRQVPPLFEAIKKAKTEHGLPWEIAMSVRRVLTKDGRVTIATGHDDTYAEELETPTKVHGLVGALFNKMTWWPLLSEQGIMRRPKPRA